jgi:hypothetical protein
MEDKKKTYPLHVYCTKKEWDIINNAVNLQRLVPGGKLRRGDVICTALIEWSEKHCDKKN